MFNKCRKCRRKKVFDKKKLKESIYMMKELRGCANEMITNPKTTDVDREGYGKWVEVYSTAIDAMEEILFDL